MNKVLLIGNLGKKPELKQVGGDSVCQFSIATSESYKDKNGEKKTETTWHNVVAWRKLAEICEQYLDKGSKIFVEGKIRNREYENKDGQKVRVSEVVMSNMEFLSEKSETGSSEQKEASPKPKKEDPLWPSESPGGDDDKEDDLPF